MIDEAHERSVNIDLILGLLKDQLYLYPHLRLIIASATIDHETFIGFYGGRIAFRFFTRKAFNIRSRNIVGDPKDPWWKPVNKGQLPADSNSALDRGIGAESLSMAGRLDRQATFGRGWAHSRIPPGSKEIDQTVSLINALHLPNVIALPLYSQRPLDEQDAALNPTRTSTRTCSGNAGCRLDKCSRDFPYR